MHTSCFKKYTLAAYLALQLSSSLSFAAAIADERDDQQSSIQNHYDLAVLYKKNAVEGVSAVDSQQRASDIFLELAERYDHAKAAHNYAVYAHAKGDFKNAKKFFKKANLPESQRNFDHLRQLDLCIILGSNRETTMSPSFINRTLYGVMNEDMRHLNTMGGNAITIDLEPCRLKATKSYTHLVGDARTLDLSKLYNRDIRHLVVERLNTLSITKSSTYDLTQMEQILSQNNHGDCLSNLARFMDTDAILEIEWEPNFTLCTLSPTQIDEVNRKNPFSGLVNFNIVSQMIEILQGSLENEDYKRIPAKCYMQFPEGNIDVIDQYMHIYNAIQFIQSTGFGDEKTIANRLMEEMRILGRASNDGHMIAIPYDLDHDEPGQFEQMYKDIGHMNVPAEYSLQVISAKMKDDKGKERTRTFHMYNGGDFFARSLLKCVVHDLVALNNFKHIEEFLAELGFENITLNRRDNVHNHRKNIWMIDAVKR